MAKRERKHTRGTGVPPSSGPLVPSAQTLFRLHLRDPTVRDVLGDALGQISPEILARDQDTIDRIAGAETVEQVLDLAAVAVGLSDRAWYRRVQAFGPEIAPLISDRLGRVREFPDEHTRSVVYEHLLGALGFYGAAGVEAVFACFDALDDYGKSLACIALGYLGAQEAASRLWAFYQSVKGNAHENFLIGPLWGLVDLEDPRAADALDELLWAERVFYETFAMAYKAGDARALVPLMYLFLRGGESLKDSAAWALVGVAHRVGRDALLAALKPSRTNTGVSLAQRRSLVDLLLRLPQRGADAYFTVFYQGLTPDMIDLEDMGTELNVMDRLRLLIEEGDLSDQEPPRPGQRPGRNDPCWCGSGAKYKHCHWRKDREQGRSAHAANVPW